MRVRAVVFVLFVAFSVFGMVGTAMPAGAGVEGASATGGAELANADAVAADAAGAPDNESSMGDQMSSFMESSAGGTDASVESEMWAAADGANGSLETRAARTEERLERLRERKERIEAAYRNGSLSEQAYRAQLSNVAGQLAALNRSVEQLEAQGADSASVQRLREDIRNVSAGNVSEVAQSMAGGPPAGLPDAAKNASRGGGNGGEGKGNGGEGKGNGNGNGNGGEGKGGEGNGGEGKGGEGNGGEGKGNGNGGEGKDGDGNGNGNDSPGNDGDDDDDGDDGG